MSVELRPAAARRRSAARLAAVQAIYEMDLAGTTADVVIDEFYTDSKFDQPMIDMARHAFMVKGNTITQVK